MHFSLTFTVYASSVRKRDQGHSNMIVGDKVRTLFEFVPCKSKIWKDMWDEYIMLAPVSYIFSTAIHSLIICSIIGVGQTILPI